VTCSGADSIRRRNAPPATGKADMDRPCVKARFETPWQDRQTLLQAALFFVRNSL
jgi:hypothetical protein